MKQNLRTFGQIQGLQEIASFKDFAWVGNLVQSGLAGEFFFFLRNQQPCRFLNWFAIRFFYQIIATIDFSFLFFLHEPPSIFHSHTDRCHTRYQPVDPKKITKNNRQRIHHEVLERTKPTKYPFNRCFSKASVNIEDVFLTPQCAIQSPLSKIDAHSPTHRKLERAFALTLNWFEFEFDSPHKSTFQHKIWIDLLKTSLFQRHREKILKYLDFFTIFIPIA